MGRGFLETTSTCIPLAHHCSTILPCLSLKGEKKKQMDKPVMGHPVGNDLVRLCWPKSEETPGSVRSM